MSIRIVQLGSARAQNEGLRLGTVRRPPRGVPKIEFALRDFYDVWLPQLAPSVDLMKMAQAAQAQGDEKAWRAFTRSFRAALGTGDAAHLLDMLAALSHQTNLSLGCYCAEESRCHRSVLRDLLKERGASFANDEAE
jgi:uncharacterized protein YeaO (DUF488 family)